MDVNNYSIKFCGNYKISENGYLNAYYRLGRLRERDDVPTALVLVPAAAVLEPVPLAHLPDGAQQGLRPSAGLRSGLQCAAFHVCLSQSRRKEGGGMRTFLTQGDTLYRKRNIFALVVTALLPLSNNNHLQLFNDSLVVKIHSSISEVF